MARYVIRLYLDAKPATGVEREIRRDDGERAILYAQNWLHRHRLSMRYMGIAFDRWMVGTSGDGSSPGTVFTGIDERSIPTAAEQHSRRQAKASRLKIAGAVTSLRSPRSRPRKITPARPMSRLAQVVAEAKLKVANNGVIPPLGSDSDGQR